MHQHRGTHRGRTATTIAAVIAGVLALLGVITYVLSGNSNSTAQPPATTTTTTTSAGNAEGALGLDKTTEPSAETKVMTGSFRQQRGMLTVEVTRIEQTNGKVTLEVSATNASTARMTLPANGIVVLDNSNRTYVASSSKWEGLLTPQGGRTSGTVVLDEKISYDVTTLTLNFTQISGQFAPTGAAISVTGIPVPR
jgi:hypothetical protein